MLFLGLAPLYKENHVSLLRVFLADPGSERKSKDLDVGGGEVVQI